MELFCFKCFFFKLQPPGVLRGHSARISFRELVGGMLREDSWSVKVEDCTLNLSQGFLKPRPLNYDWSFLTR